MEIELPREVPAMTLPQTVFFPQALLPLHIFEPRYRQMLRDVLGSHRLFAVAQLDERAAQLDAEAVEPPHAVATVGIVRACQKNENGTSNLLLQGLCRVRLVRIVREAPYRFIEIEPLQSVPGGEPEELARLRDEAVELIGVKRKLGLEVPEPMADFLAQVADPEAFSDLAAFNACDDAREKQRLLETLDIKVRLERYGRLLRREIAAAQLRRKLQGGLSDDAIALN
jgi:Lon protease-like protein